MGDLRLFLVVAFLLDSSFSQVEQDRACHVKDFCKYKCRCIKPCQADFKCSTNDKCQSGWFGFRCQYQDLAVFGATVTTDPPGMYTDWLTDENDYTCNTAKDLNSVTVTWAKLEAIPLTWWRITVNDPRFLVNVQLQFTREGNFEFEKSSCRNETISEVSDKSIDRRCNDDVTITSLTLSGNLSSLCSFYISGGRNVAFNQHAWQSSRVPEINGSADLAVDGNTESNYFRNSCTHTKTESSPSWTLTLQSSYVIQRLIIYNRGDGYSERLRGFWVKTYDASRSEIGYYKDKGVLDKVPIYYVNLKKVSSAVNYISIRLNGTYGILTLCEVEAYGECPAGKWSLPCNKQCPTSCPKDCDRDTGKCNTVCIGYSDPPQCDSVCSIGKWGVNCRNNCSNKCASSICDSKTGLCNQACLGYSDPPYCNTVCSVGKWGVNCRNNCSNKCDGSICDRKTGLCNQGCLGYSDPPYCNIVCSIGKWGVNCRNNCSNKCASSICDSKTGLCNQACLGYSDPPYCNTVCSVGKWGVNCRNNCSNKCDGSICDRKTGLCNQGCLGYSDPPYCNIACSAGKWGVNCRNNCSNKCAICDSKTGLCNQSCLGYSDPPYCNTECPKGQWGVNCTSTCNENCNDKSCDQKEGSCNSGCVEGYQPPDCLQKICSLEMNSFAMGGAAGTGVTVLVILALLLIKTLVTKGRQKKKLDSVYDQTNLHPDDSQHYDQFFKTDQQNEDVANIYEESV
ncbi:multiple epidermal growth factor domains 10 [Biomphalaria glabrata]|nr:multiple epidermal growth factor domains 10 [Biomphalaria glabrata]